MYSENVICTHEKKQQILDFTFSLSTRKYPQNLPRF